MDLKTFQRGETPRAFVESMQEPVREKFNALLQESRAGLTASDQGLSLAPDVRVVVIAEPWSGDVLYNLPALLALAESQDWQVRIFRRDENLALIEPYKKDGIYLSIPVFIFFDEEFRELAHWIERPQIATKTIDEESLNLRRKLREENKAAWRAATLDELKDLLAQ